MKKICMGLLIAAILLALAVYPAAAVLPELHMKGQVSVIKADKHTMTLNVEYVLEGTEWVPYAATHKLRNFIVAGATDNPLIIKELKQGDYVEAVLLGSEDDGEWIAIGKTGNIGLTDTPFTALYGDPSKLVSKFYQGYSIQYDTFGDCDKCTGSVCEAGSADVSVYKDDVLIETKTMLPGETYIFGKDTENQYVLETTFNFGESSSYACSSEPGMAGPQPISDFTAYTKQRSEIIKEVISQLPEQTETPAVQTEVQTPEQTPVSTPVQTEVPAAQPTEAGMGIFTLIAAVSGILAAAVYRK